jgi:hypothetical protein
MLDREAGSSCAASGRFWGQHEVPQLLWRAKCGQERVSRFQGGVASSDDFALGRCDNRIDRNKYRGNFDAEQSGRLEIEIGNRNCRDG